MAEVEGHGRCLSIEDAHEIKEDQSYLMVYTYLAKGFTLGRRLPLNEQETIEHQQKAKRNLLLLFNSDTCSLTRTRSHNSFG